MANSQNGWTAYSNGAHPDLVAIPHVVGRVRRGQVATIFQWLVAEFDRTVEAVGEAAGQPQNDWGWADRPIRGGVATSNHASGTGLDLNSDKHPLGAVGTFSPAQVRRINEIVAFAGGVLRWGGSYSGRKDEMHWEINVPPGDPRLAKLVAKITGPTAPVKTTRFWDVPKSHPFYSQIEWMASTGVSTGYADDTFRPSEPVLREQWAAFLFRLSNPAGFVDLPDAAGFRDEIAWIIGKGISQGYGDGTFRPAMPVTRDAAAAMLYRLAGSPDFTPDKTAQAFADVRPDTTFYKEIEWLQFIGVTTGYPNPEPHGRPLFQPAEPLLREQAAVFLNRFANRRS